MALWPLLSKIRFLEHFSCKTVDLMTKKVKGLMSRKRLHNETLDEGMVPTPCGTGQPGYSEGHAI